MCGGAGGEGKCWGGGGVLKRQQEESMGKVGELGGCEKGLWGCKDAQGRERGEGVTQDARQRRMRVTGKA